MVEDLEEENDIEYVLDIRLVPEDVIELLRCMLSKEENDPLCLCRTFRPGDPSVGASSSSTRGAVDARLRLRFTVVKKPLFLFSCIELAGELPAGLEFVVVGESRAKPGSDGAELCRFHFNRSMVISCSKRLQFLPHRLFLDQLT
jgi:hypothetical protein